MSSGSRWTTREDIERDMGMIAVKKEEPLPEEEEDLYGLPNIELIRKSVKNQVNHSDERLLFTPAPKSDFDLDRERKLLEKSCKMEARKKENIKRNAVLSQFEVYTPEIVYQNEPVVPILNDLQAFPSLPKK